MSGAPGRAAPSCFRPGGLELTDRALAFCAFPPGACLLDLGCGEGATVRHVRRDYGYWIIGADSERFFADEAEGICWARAEELPFPASSMDGVLMECSLSVTEDPEAALEECRRVLRPGGLLAVSDLYARGQPARFSGAIGRVERREDILAALSRHGFETRLFEDHSEELLSLWASLVFELGAEAFHAGIGACRESLKAARCGYFLLVAGRGSS